MEDAELGSQVQLTKPVFEQCNPSAPKERPPLLSGCSADSSSRNPESASSSLREKVVLKAKDHGSTSSAQGVQDLMSKIVSDRMKKSIDDQCSSDPFKGFFHGLGFHVEAQIKFKFNFSSFYSVADLMESIEKEYVLVNSHFASVDAFSFYLDTSVQDNSTTRVSVCSSKKNDDLADAMHTKELAVGCAGAAEISQFNESVPSETSCRSSILKELQGLTILHPSTRLQFLHQYVHALTELAQEKVMTLFLSQMFSIPHSRCLS